MTVLHTQNLQIPYPDSTELVANGFSNITSLAQAIDGGPNGPTVTRVITGTLAGLPQPASNYALGTLYQCTDAACMFLRSAAATWVYIAVGQSPPPLGSVQFFAGNFDPADPDGVTRWLLCDGRVLSRATYVSLFAVIGTSFGAGNGTTTFNIPSGANNIILGANTVGPATVRPLGSTGGEASHSLTINEMVSHTHTDSGHTHTVGEQGFGHQHDSSAYQFVAMASNPGQTEVTAAAGNTVVTASSFVSNSTTGTATTAPLVNSASANIQPFGSGSSHENRMPYLTVNQIIRVL